MENNHHSNDKYKDAENGSEESESGATKVGNHENQIKHAVKSDEILSKTGLVDNQIILEKSIIDIKKNGVPETPINCSENLNQKKIDKNDIIVIQRPKRTKSRKSLRKMPSINNIDYDVNTNIYRTDR